MITHPSDFSVVKSQIICKGAGGADDHTSGNFIAVIVLHLPGYWLESAIHVVNFFHRRELLCLEVESKESARPRSFTVRVSPNSGTTKLTAYYASSPWSLYSRS
ncbi:Hypothetical predicted protein [Olea europaea subsp. europaea]|uniref:Uncharacterized protein n=1 Tax=Olea europaea subsp. europaea TaxID=158383 RepID=A0A8S0RKV8_OLEEU|nr:Hypothetical predicted protein [Olea europaea subsp. europaea]